MRIHLFIWLLLLACLQTNRSAYAQIESDQVRLEFQTLGNKEGLSQGFVPSMLQDKEGYI
ncbi:hypothetical protein EMGBS15_10570 [Filimonas sp.]|nr:hypothetical protein EMGBS15_10570 [Filimonas sp.]